MERNLFGISAVIASFALLIWSIGDTFAYPQGPNVSLGSNPIAANYCSANTNWTNATNQTFVITDLASLNNTAYLYVGGTGHTDLRAVFIEHSPISYVTGIPVSPGDYIHCGSNAIVFSGYYTH